MPFTYDDDIWPQVQKHPWKWMKRQSIEGIIIHCTRSGIAGRTPLQEYNSTKNWFLSPNNRVENGGAPYAGMSNVCFGGGKKLLAVPDEFAPRFSAGVHDWKALSVELGQANLGDPFDPRDIANLRLYVEEKSKLYGFTTDRILFVDGLNDDWPGLVGHEDTAQGRGQGKSDPGALFWEVWDTKENEVTREEYVELATAVFGEKYKERMAELKANGNVSVEERMSAMEGNGDSVARAAIAKHEGQPHGIGSGAGTYTVEGGSITIRSD